MDCIFCNIINKKAPATVAYEDDEVMVFKNIRPLAPVHFLSVPKVHVTSVMHLDETHKNAMWKVIMAAKKVAEDMGLKGYKLVFNVGREGGQVIDHLHLHLLGGWEKGAKE